MHNLPVMGSVQNKADPRPILAKFRLWELKALLKNEGVKFNAGTLTAVQARAMVESSGIDVMKYVQYVNGLSYFKEPEPKTKKAAKED